MLNALSNNDLTMLYVNQALLYVIKNTPNGFLKYVTFALLILNYCRSSFGNFKVIANLFVKNSLLNNIGLVVDTNENVYK